MDDLAPEARGLFGFRARALLQPIFAALLEGLGDLQQPPLLGGGALALVALALRFAPRLRAARRVVVGPEVGVEQGLVARRRLLFGWSVVGLVVVREGVAHVVFPSQSSSHRLWPSFHARGGEAREAE